MTSPPSLTIAAVVHGAERRALVAASRQLADSVTTASGSPFSVALRFGEALPANGLATGRTVLVASPQVEIPGRDEPLDRTQARWRDQLSSLIRNAAAPPFLCTIFRHVADRESPTLIERIRRLNLMVIELSHDTGAAVADIDRILGYFGARQLQTDYRLGGRLGSELAGHTIVASILAAGLDDIIAPDVQERAQSVRLAMLERLSGEASW